MLKLSDSEMQAVIDELMTRPLTSRIGIKRQNLLLSAVYKMQLEMKYRKADKIIWEKVQHIAES